jgi:CheY-like chemotaxis protein
MPRIGRVLVIDDEPLVAQSLRIALRDEFEISATTDPALALEVLTSGDWYDVIMCDVAMPGFDGVEFRTRLNELRPELAERIVFITGGIMVPGVQAMLDGMPNLVLTKPFDFPGLRELLRRRTHTAPLRASGS